jgi:hypothetical protein
LTFGRRAINTIILNKSRPDKLKTPEFEPYFATLEKLLLQISKDSATGAAAAGLGGFIGNVDEIYTDSTPRLTADCDSITSDNDYISADIE